MASLQCVFSHSQRQSFLTTTSLNGREYAYDMLPESCLLRKLPAWRTAAHRNRRELTLPTNSGSLGLLYNLHFCTMAALENTD